VLEARLLRQQSKNKMHQQDRVPNSWASVHAVSYSPDINGYNREEMLGQEGNRNHIFHYRIPWYR
jgi:hypothetical protein